MNIKTKFNIDEIVYIIGPTSMASFMKDCEFCNGKETLIALINGEEKEVACSCKNDYHSRNYYFNSVEKARVDEIQIGVDWRKEPKIGYALITDEDRAFHEEEYVHKTEREALEFCVRENESIVKSMEEKGCYLKKVDKEKMNSVLMNLQKIKLNKDEKK